MAVIRRLDENKFADVCCYTRNYDTAENFGKSNLSPEIPEHVIQEAIQLRMEFIPSPPQEPPPPQKKTSNHTQQTPNNSINHNNNQNFRATKSSFASELKDIKFSPQPAASGEDTLRGRSAAVSPD